MIFSNRERLCFLSGVEAKRQQVVVVAAENTPDRIQEDKTASEQHYRQCLEVAER